MADPQSDVYNNGNGDNRFSDDDDSSGSESEGEAERQEELCQILENESCFRDLLHDDDDEERDEFDANGETYSSKKKRHDQTLGNVSAEENFIDGLNQKNAKGKMATSTPFASSQRPAATLLQQTLPASPLWTENRGNGDTTPQKILRERWGKQVLSGTRETRGRDPGVGDYHENGYGGPSVPSTSYHYIKGIEKSFPRGLSRYDGHDFAENAAGNEIPYFVQPQNISDLLNQEALQPPSRVKELEKVCDERGEMLQELRAETEQLNGQLEQLQEEAQQRIVLLSEEKGDLQAQLQKIYIMNQAQQDDIEKLRAVLQGCKTDLDMFSLEKQDLLKTIYASKGTIDQLQDQLRKSTSWEIIDQIKHGHEEAILKLKNMHDSDIRKLHEERAKEESSQDMRWNAMKSELKELHEKFRDSENSKMKLQDALTNLQRENSLKNGIQADRRSDQKTIEILQMQLQVRTDDLSRSTEKMSQTEANHNSRYKLLKDENEKLRDDLVQVNHDNTRLVDEQAAAVQDRTKLQDELANLTAEYTSLRKHVQQTAQEQTKLQNELTKRNGEISFVKIENLRTETERTKLQAELTKLTEEFASIRSEHQRTFQEKMKLQEVITHLTNDIVALKKENKRTSQDHAKLLEISTLQKSLDNLKQKLAQAEDAKMKLQDSVLTLGKAAKNEDLHELLRRKDAQYSQESRKFREVEDRLHSQLRSVADENIALRSQNAVHEAQLHKMKKVYKKIKRDMLPKQSPSGDSGMYSDMRTDTASRTVTVSTGDHNSAGQDYLRELITLKENFKRVVDEQRKEMERSYQQQLAIDRAHMEAAYGRTLQQVLSGPMNGHPAGTHRSFLLEI